MHWIGIRENCGEPQAAPNRPGFDCDIGKLAKRYKNSCIALRVYQCHSQTQDDLARPTAPHNFHESQSSAFSIFLGMGICYLELPQQDNFQHLIPLLGVPQTLSGVNSRQCIFNFHSSQGNISIEICPVLNVFHLCLALLINEMKLNELSQKGHSQLSQGGHSQLPLLGPFQYHQ